MLLKAALAMGKWLKTKKDQKWQPQKFSMKKEDNWRKGHPP